MKPRTNNLTHIALGELVDFRNGISFSATQMGRGIPMVGVADFLQPILRTTQHLDRVDVASGLPRSAYIQADDLLFVRSNGSKELVGRAMRVLVVDEPTTHAGFTIRARPHNPDEWSEFLWQYFQSGIPLLLMRRFNGGTNITNLSQDLLAALPVPDIGAPGRSAFCAILRRWDSALLALHELIILKRCMRDGLMQQFLTGRRRLPAFTKRVWKEVRLRDVTAESIKRNGTLLGADRVMAVTKTSGLRPMREQTMADSLTRYKVVVPGGFAYNPMRINIGSIARSAFDHDVLVSPDYVVFETLPAQLDPRFLDYSRRAHPWRQFMAAAGNGSVRVRIYYDDLGAIRLPLPEVAEQSAIADVLDAATREIDTLVRLRDAIAQQKRGLMQKLLTGEIRVPTHEPATLGVTS